MIGCQLSNLPTDLRLSNLPTSESPHSSEPELANRCSSAQGPTALSSCGLTGRSAVSSYNLVRYSTTSTSAIVHCQPLLYSATPVTSQTLSLAVKYCTILTDSWMGGASLKIYHILLLVYRMSERQSDRQSVRQKASQTERKSDRETVKKSRVLTQVKTG